MADYIDRDLTIQYLCEACSNFEGNICTLSEECEDIRIIRAMSAENVQPVRHGRWEYIRNVKLSGTVKLCECNQCHNKIFGGLSYCGNCGARMDGDTNG